MNYSNKLKKHLLRENARGVFRTAITEGFLTDHLARHRFLQVKLHLNIFPNIDDSAL